MNCLVTGAGGFIGSHLCEALLAAGHQVTGLDAFIPYYPAEIKARNLTAANSHAHFRFHRLDLRTEALETVVSSAEVIFHLAAMPGLSRSWTDFDLYASCNVLATQRLLEAARKSAKGLRRLVYGSSSSVYGRSAPGDESLPTEPISPYGITKLAAEHLCRAYGEEFQLPAVVLRYFSVYGPRQRPDMGYYKFIDALLRDQEIIVYGDGQQVRGNTYVGDCVEATVAAIGAPAGQIYNVGGGETASVRDILRKLETIAGNPAQVKEAPARPGDQQYTFADTAKLRAQLGWRPKTTLDEGLRRQWEWQKGEHRGHL